METPVIARLLILACALLAACPAMARDLRGRVVGITDGDTVTVRDAAGERHRVRLTGIDAPERDQPYGEPSRESLTRMLLERNVRVEYTKKDDGGRILGKVWVQPADCPRCALTLDANLAQLSAGAAWWYRHYRNEQSPEDRGRYEFAEQEARVKRAGLWRQPDPVPPWEWRHARQPVPRESRAGSARQTESCRIKGNINDTGERIYHRPGQQHYEDTQISTARGERWFCSETEARAAGWRAARN
jgi:endonuclease YncB( thermonuclease family)